MKNKISQIVMIASMFFALPISSFAQAGSLDLSFGVGGKVITDIGSWNNYAKSLAIQADGKIVVAGYSKNATFDNDFALIRYNTNGNLDTTFDNDGKVTTPIGTNNDEGNSVAIQSDGKIVVVGSSVIGAYRHFALVRYNTNGSLDTTFDGDGKVTTGIGISHDGGNSLVIQSDGKIVVAGFSNNGSKDDFALTRYNTNGSLDTTFDNDGRATTTIGMYNDVVSSVTIQSDGKIVVAGYSGNGISGDFALARYNPNGSLDSSFDADGKVITNVWLSSWGFSIVIQSNGKIIVAGDCNNYISRYIAICRYNINGSLDSSFDADGKVITKYLSNGHSFVKSVALQSDGKILVAGQSDTSTTIPTKYDFALLRCNSNGSIDTTFDMDGKVITSIGIGHNKGSSSVIQTDGKIIVAGHAHNGSNNDFALIRYNVDSCVQITFSQSPLICDGQNLTVGGNTYNLSGTYIDVFTSLVSGCDSIVTTNLTVLPTYSFSQLFTICAGQSITVGSNIYNITGIYIDTLTSLVSGCDSIVTTNLTILPTNSFSQSFTICAGQSITVGSNIYNITGIYIDTLISLASGCDSIVTLNLTVLPANTFSQSPSICAGQSITVGSNIYNITGIYIDNLISLVSGCDSIVSTNLTVLPANTFSQSPAICTGQNITIGSNVYSVAGIYVDTFVAVSTCDSIVTTNLTVTPMPILTTNVVGIVISSNQATANYQWIDCTNNLPIAGASNQSFTPLANGNYAVIVTMALCGDTSTCVNVSTVGISQYSNNVVKISIYPNPFSSSTIIETDFHLKNATLNVYDIYGQQVKQINNLSGHTFTVYRENLPNGMYFIQLSQDNIILSTNKLVITDSQ